jgi:hypothetical protein
VAEEFPGTATFSTLITAPLAIEGMTGDGAGNLYVPGVARQHRHTVAGMDQRLSIGGEPLPVR